MSKRTVTITDIANELGISVSTVSCVMRGDAEKFRIAPATERRIMIAAGDMGYVPNQSARNLRAMRSNFISVLFSDLELSWADNVLKGIETVTNEAGYGIFIAVDRRNSKLFAHEVEAILQRRDEAVICHSHSIVLSEIEKLRNAIPLVFVSDLPEQLSEVTGLYSVLWDSSYGIEKAINHFAAIGRKKIAFVGYRHGFLSDTARYEAFVKALAPAGLEHSEDRCVWLSESDLTSGNTIKSLFSGKNIKPDGIFALNDSIAISLIRQIRGLGLKVPEDVAVIGIGDLPMSEFVGLTTIAEPLQELGRKSADIVMKLINNTKVAPVSFVESNNLVIRTSA
jgi:LacI family transcriptional regulator